MFIYTHIIHLIATAHHKHIISISENIYDQIPSEQYYDAPYEMRTNDEVYEPEPNRGNVITINGISVR